MRNYPHSVMGDILGDKMGDILAWVVSLQPDMFRPGNGGQMSLCPVSLITVPTVCFVLFQTLTAGPLSPPGGLGGKKGQRGPTPPLLGRGGVNQSGTFLKCPLVPLGFVPCRLTTIERPPKCGSNAKTGRM